MKHETTEQYTSCLPESLTGMNADGDVYRRLRVVDMQIQMALELDHGELRRRSKITDKVSPDFLKEECLVYLIRHYHRAGNRDCVNNLSKSLLSRCATWINGQLRSLGDEAVTEGYSDVVERLFERILDLGSDRGDFLQVRFWLCLERLTVQAYRKQLRQLASQRKQRKLKQFASQQDCIPLTSLAGNDGEEGDELTHKDGGGAPITLTTRTVESAEIEKLIHEALSQLEGPLRSVYLLRHYEEWPIEDQDPNVRTISRHFNKTPRTIRNWLARAEECLAEWRGEKNEQTN